MSLRLRAALTILGVVVAIGCGATSAELVVTPKPEYVEASPAREVSAEAPNADQPAEPEPRAGEEESPSSEEEDETIELEPEPEREPPRELNTFENQLWATLGADVVIRGSGEIGGLTWVVFDALGARLWYGARDTRRPRPPPFVNECNDPEVHQAEMFCRTVAPRGSRRDFLWSQYRADCVERRGGAVDDCEERFEMEMPLDPGELCRELHVALVERHEGAPAVIRSQAKISDCANNFREVTSRDLDGDGVDELLVDYVLSDVDTTHEQEDFERRLSTVSLADETVSVGTPVVMGRYPGDYSERHVLCSHRLSGRPARLRRRCCQLGYAAPPSEEGEDPDEDNGEAEIVRDANGERVWRAMGDAPPSRCGDRIAHTLRYNASSGFTDVSDPLLEL